MAYLTPIIVEAMRGLMIPAYEVAQAKVIRGQEFEDTNSGSPDDQRKIKIRRKRILNISNGRRQMIGSEEND